MNKPTVVTLLVLAASIALAGTAAASRPTATEIVVNCQTRALPSQSDVGRMLGIDNFSAAYAARSRLMVNAAQACQRQGAGQVRLTLAPDAGAKPAGRLASVGGALGR